MRRWGEFAAENAGECVGADAGTGDSSPTGSGSATGSTSGPTNSTSGPSTTAGSQPSSATASESSGGMSLCPGWEDADATRRAVLRYTSSTDFDNFPIMVVLDPDRIAYDQADPQGRDVVFYGNDGAPLSHELAIWNPGGQSILWVSDDPNQGPNNLRMYYGGAPSYDPGEGQNVWDHADALAWHLDGNGIESSDEGLTLELGDVSFLDSPRGEAASFDGMIGTVAESGLVLDDAQTLSVWLRPRNSKQESTVLYRLDGTAGFRLNLTSGGRALGLVYTNFGPLGQSWATDVAPLLPGTWYHVAVVDEGNLAEPKLYVDGERQPVQEYGNSDELEAGQVPGLVVGESPDAGSAFLGDLDELRIATELRNVNWLGMVILSETNALLTFDATESCP